MNIKQLKQYIQDLPDDFPVYSWEYGDLTLWEKWNVFIDTDALFFP